MKRNCILLFSEKIPFNGFSCVETCNSFIAVLFTLQRACGLHNNILYNPILLVNSNVDCQSLSPYCLTDLLLLTDQNGLKLA